MTYIIGIVDNERERGQTHGPRYSRRAERDAGRDGRPDAGGGGRPGRVDKRQTDKRQYKRQTVAPRPADKRQWSMGRMSGVTPPRGESVHKY